MVRSARFRLVISTNAKNTNNATNGNCRIKRSSVKMVPPKKDLTTGFFLLFFRVSVILNFFSNSELCTPCSGVPANLVRLRDNHLSVYQSERSLPVPVKILFNLTLKISRLHKILTQPVFQAVVCNYH